MIVTRSARTTSTKIPFRLCFHSFCSQWQISTEVHCSAAYVLPRIRTKFYPGPAAWNTLPSDLHDITDTSTFWKRLKNVLFDRAYNWLQLTIAGAPGRVVQRRPTNLVLIDWLIYLIPILSVCSTHSLTASKQLNYMNVHVSFNFLQFLLAVFFQLYNVAKVWRCHA